MKKLSLHLALPAAAVLTCGIAGAADGPPVSISEVLATRGVRAEFRNPWFTADPTGDDVEPTATTFFDGNVCGAIGTAPPPDCPDDGTIHLVSSSFGQPFSPWVPYSTSPNCPAGETCDFTGAALLRARKLLYWTEGEDRIGDAPEIFEYSRDDAAFRYKDFLYTDVDGLGPANRIEARLSTMADFYTSAHRTRLVMAERFLRDALKYARGDTALRNALLDLYYDRAVAEQAFAKEKLVDVARRRLDPPPEGGFVIDGEIADFEAALGSDGSPGGYRFALAGYFELLRDTLGVSTSGYDDAAASDQPFGAYIFQQEVPLRALHGATYLTDVDSDGEVDDPTPVWDNGAQPLFGGFKDLVLLFDILSSYGDATVQLSRLYAMRGLPSDEGDALTLINEAQEKLFLEGSMLLGLFPGALPGPGDQSGLAEAIAGWRQSMSTLQATRDLLLGKSNLLGYTDDFLMLIQKFQPAGGADLLDSYDAIVQHMQTPSTGPLSFAMDKHAAALGSYENYKGHQDDLGQQYFDRENGYNTRLFQIVRANRDQPGYDEPYECGPNGANQGSEICLQQISIEVAINRVERNEQEIENLKKQLEFEIDRRAFEKGIEGGINNIIVDYGGRQAALTEEISHISAAQAVSNAMAQGASKWITSLGASVAAGAVNAAVQQGAELRKAQLQGQKERLAAEERVRINDQQGLILDNNSEAQIRTWLLQMSILALDSREATLLLTQEQGRLTALINEKAEIERRMDRENEQLAERYFADPVHLLRMQTGMLAAFDAFQTAQHWMFYAVRALEYKWNVPFLHTKQGTSTTFSKASLFKLRNATELNDMLAAMEEFDTLLDTQIADDYLDRFSVREDFFGYRFQIGGVIQFYPDPDTGELLNAIEAFRRRITTLMDVDGNIFLDFSTVRQIPGGFLFRGPRFSSTGEVVSKGLYLDKIRYLEIALPGSHTTPQTNIFGQLTYGGTSFIRTQDMGTIDDPDDPAHITGEMTQYSTRYWFFDSNLDRWQFREGLTLPAVMQKSTDPNVPPSVNQIDGFAERSVAATNWTLLIPTRDLGFELLDIDELNDIELYFYHFAFARP